MKVGIADDYVEADGKVVLDYWQAQDLAHAITRGERPNAANGPITIGHALDNTRPTSRFAAGMLTTCAASGSIFLKLCPQKASRSRPLVTFAHGAMSLLQVVFQQR